MALHPQAGQPADLAQLCNIPKLVSAYYTHTPDPEDPHHAVSFGTSGHRGCALDCTFNEAHIAAICQAIVEYRDTNAIDGPMFIGMDTHALSEAAFVTTLEVMLANDVQVIVQAQGGYTPTPVISHAILNYNRTHKKQADGIVITPSHNPPEDGGFKYNPPNGGPADSDVTQSIEKRANDIIADSGREIKRMTIRQAKQSANYHEDDLRINYVEELDQVVDMQAIRRANLKLGTDPLGGAGLAYWDMISDKYGLNIDVVNRRVDPTFSFMHRDKDGKLRMDCSSPYAMAGLIKLKDHYDLAFGNDPDFDRHGIVSPSSGILNPNHYLAVAIDYLYQHRTQWHPSLKIGKTLVSSSMIDRVAKHLKRSVSEMPVGFKWFVDGLLSAQIGFAGEESAGGIFLRKDGSTWATDKDGIIMCLLGAEITAVTGKDPGQYYQDLTQKFGEPSYRRLDVPANSQQKKALSSMTADVISNDGLAGEAITSVQTVAPGNNASIGGVKVSTENGWFAARPSGTESIYKIYAESFKGEAHLSLLIDEAKSLVQGVFDKAGC